VAVAIGGCSQGGSDARAGQAVSLPAGELIISVAAARVPPPEAH